VKRARSFKQFTLTTARGPAVVSATARDDGTATTADQKITGARSVAVILDQQPITRPNFE
jgi:hypothetical protein